MKHVILFVAAILACYGSNAQSVPAYILTSGLQAWYPFSGNANNGWGSAGKNGIVLGPTLTADRFGTANSAYHFNGSTDHILIDTAFFNVGWSDLTVSFWLNADSIDNPNNGNNNMSMFNTIPHNGICLVSGWMTDYKYLLWANQTPGTHTWDILPGVQSHTSLAAHVWRHYVAVKQHDTSYSFYLNGVLDSTYHNSTTASTYLCKLVLGNTDSSVGNFGFWGALDDYAIWSRSLAPCEVSRLHSSSPYSYIVTQPVGRTVHAPMAAYFTISDTGTGHTYQWQVDSGSGFRNLIASAIYSGVTTPTLTVATASFPSMDSIFFRCIVSGPQVCVDTSDSAYLVVLFEGLVPSANGPQFSVTPNPTSGDITVESPGNVHIKVYNILGQLVKEARQSRRISIAGNAPGTYVLQLYDEQERMIYRAKVVLQ